MGSSQLNKLCDIFKILLILSQGQAQVERGFSANSQILVDNLHSASLIAQRVINDDMEVHELASYEVKITKKLIDHVKQCRSRYFGNQKDCSLQTLKTSREMKVKELNEQLEDANRSILQLQKTITSVKADADQYALDAEKKSKLDDIKNFISKSNALKRAAKKKEEL